MPEFDPQTKQFERACTLIVSGQLVGAAGGAIAGAVGTGIRNGLDLSQFRIKFSVKRSDSPVPNTADIIVYNVDFESALRIQREFTQVTLQAGYPGNFGVIFQGNIRQVIIGRESATDTFINIIAGDGDRAYNFAIVNTSLAKGSKASDQINTAITAMTEKGVTEGFVDDLPVNELPRGKVMFGSAKKFLRNIAKTTERSWSIQDGKVNFVYRTAYLPGEQVVITSKTGMIGTPQQTNEGVNVKCLLNPNIQIAGRVYLDNENIQIQKLNLEQIAAARGDVKAINALQPRKLNASGSYRVYVLEHQGDTRGTEWYTSLICLDIDISANPNNSVTGGVSG